MFFIIIRVCMEICGEHLKPTHQTQVNNYSVQGYIPWKILKYSFHEQ